MKTNPDDPLEDEDGLERDDEDPETDILHPPSPPAPSEPPAQSAAPGKPNGSFPVSVKTNMISHIEEEV